MSVAARLRTSPPFTNAGQAVVRRVQPQAGQVAAGLRGDVAQGGFRCGSYVGGDSRAVVLAQAQPGEQGAVLGGQHCGPVDVGVRVDRHGAR